MIYCLSVIKKFRSFAVPMALMVFIVCVSCIKQPESLYERSFYIMGSKFAYKLYCKNKNICSDAVAESQKRLREIDHIFSNYRDDSVLSRVNSRAGTEPVRVPKEFIDLTNSSIEYSGMTGGAFDISVGYLFDIWKAAVKRGSVPTYEQVLDALRCTGYEKIEVNRTENTVFFKSDCLKLDYGAIGKGYAVDQVAEILKEHGIKNFLLNFGGNILVIGNRKDAGGWDVSIQDPFHKDRVLTEINVSGTGIATSGDYEKYFVIKGKKYSHIINPSTGFPVEGITSVTVLADSAESADVLATAFSVTGLEKTKNYIRNNSGVAVITVQGDAPARNIYKSQRFRTLEKSPELNKAAEN